MTATFTCRSNSHPFQERRVSLTEPAKIGRSVARARPAATNAIFDCKVLSRNHALLWCEEGKFYLKDTKSSNGTFVNNQRLSKGSEESLPFEVNSGDIVQFGVDVVENSRRVTHGCIVSQVRLYLPNGEEAKQSDVSLTSHLLDKVPHSLVYPTIQSQDLYQLHQYLQEALHREQMLEQKLALLQRLVADSHETSEKGWQALIDEDKLLSRLEFLENQLQTYAKTLSEESTQKQLLHLQEEKHNYETTSKETLRQVLGEKLEAQQKLGNLERSYSNAEDECTHLRDVLTKTQKDLKELAEKHQHHVRESQKLSEKAQDAERSHLEDKKKLEQENEDHLKTIQRLEETEKDLQQRLEDSLEEVEKYQLEIEDLRSQIEKLKTTSNSLESKKDLSKSEVINGSANLKDKLNDILSNQGDIDLTDIKVSLKEDEIEVVKTIEICERPPEEKMNVVSIPFTTEYDNLQPSSANENDHEVDEEMRERILITKLEARIAQLGNLVSETQTSQKAEETKRKEIETQLENLQKERENEKEMLTETAKELQAALSERETLLEKEEKLKTRIEESEKLLQTCESDSVSSSSEAEEIGQAEENDDIACGSLIIAKAKLKELKKKLKEKESQLAAAQADLEMSNKVDSSALDKSQEFEDVKASLFESEERVKTLEGELVSLRASADETSELQNELEQSRRLAKEKCELYDEAQRRIQLAEKSQSDLKALKEQLQKEQLDKTERIKELEELLSSAKKNEENYAVSVKEKSEMVEKLKQRLDQITNNLKQGDAAELTQKNVKLAEEKQQLLNDMQSLKAKLELQQKGESRESGSEREQLEEKLKAKQEEVDSANKKFSDLLDEQQKLLHKVSEQATNNAGFSSAFFIALFAVLIGVAYILWQSR